MTVSLGKKWTTMPQAPQRVTEEKIALGNQYSTESEAQ